MSNTRWKIFQILWPSQNIRTLQPNVKFIFRNQFLTFSVSWIGLSIALYKHWNSMKRATKITIFFYRKPHAWLQDLQLIKGHLISKANCQAEDSSKKRTNEFVFTSMRPCFLEESSAREKRFEIIWPLATDCPKSMNLTLD